MRLPNAVTVPKVPTGLWSLQRDGVTTSLLTNFMLCPEKHRLAYSEGLTLLVPTQALGFGALVHDILDKIYTAMMQGDVEADLTQLLFYASVVLEESEQAARETAIRSTDQFTAINTIELIYGKAEAIIPAYLERWVGDFANAKWLGLEEKFDVPLKLPNGVTVRVRGKRDGRYRSKRDNSMWLFESKTKARIVEDTIIDRLFFDHQCMLYLWTMWKEFGEVPAGAIYNIIRAPLLRRGKSESIAAFVKRIKDDVASRPDHYFTRLVSSVKERDLVQWEQEFKDQVMQLYRWDRGEYHYRNSSACEAFGVACRFLPVCSRNDRSRFFTREVTFSELETANDLIEDLD